MVIDGGCIHGPVIAQPLSRGAGYLASYSADCTGTIAIGQTKECTVTNNDIQPKLTVIKNVVNDNGGTKTPADFTLNVDGGSPVPASFAGSTGTEVTLDAGSYSVTEDEVDGYAGTFSEGCSGVLAPGETATCTVTNNDLTAGLTVVKRVVNDNGGTKEAADFEISVASAGTTLRRSTAARPEPSWKSMPVLTR